MTFQSIKISNFSGEHPQKKKKKTLLEAQAFSPPMIHQGLKKYPYFTYSKRLESLLWYDKTQDYWIISVVFHWLRNERSGKRFSHTLLGVWVRVHGGSSGHVAFPSPPTHPPCVFWVVGFQVVPQLRLFLYVNLLYLGSVPAVLLALFWCCNSNDL